MTVKGFVATIVVLTAGAGLSAQSTAPSKPAAKPSAMVITLTALPAPPKVGDTQLTVTVKQAGKPVADADVSVLFVMPAMPEMKMAEMRNEVKLTSAGAGTYSGKGKILMSGTWTVTVSVKKGGKEIGVKKLDLTAK
jgi:YtkA-like protein